MRPNMKNVACAMAVLTVIACGDDVFDPGDAGIQVTAVVAGTEDPIVLVVENMGQERIHYVGELLEMHVDGEWRGLGMEISSQSGLQLQLDCLPPIKIAPGEKHSVETANVPAALSPGEYRLRVTLSPSGQCPDTPNGIRESDWVAAYTDPFEIGDP